MLVHELLSKTKCPLFTSISLVRNSPWSWLGLYGHTDLNTLGSDPFLYIFATFFKKTVCWNCRNRLLFQTNTVAKIKVPTYIVLWHGGMPSVQV